MQKDINLTPGETTKRRSKASGKNLKVKGRGRKKGKGEKVNDCPINFPPFYCAPVALAYPLHVIVMVVTGVVGWEVEGWRGLRAGQGEIVLAV